MNEQERAIQHFNRVWREMQARLTHWTDESLFNTVPDFGPSPVGDPDAEELQRIFEMESPE